jgi:hypothetical protein
MRTHAGRSERPPPVGSDACHLHDPMRLHLLRDVRRVPDLLVCNERSQVVVSPRLVLVSPRLALISPVCSKRIDRRKFRRPMPMASPLYAWTVNACPSPIWVLRLNTPAPVSTPPHLQPFASAGHMCNNTASFTHSIA